VRKPKNKFYELENVAITALSSEAKGIAKLDGKVIFVDNALDGDIVNIKARKGRKNYDTGEIVSFIEKSSKRIEPYCAHYEFCGGCKIQHLSYENQLEWKTQVLKDALERIGKVDYPEISPILGCEETRFYRNKLDYAASNSRWLTVAEINDKDTPIDRNGIGFHKAGMFDKVIDINTCYHMPEPANEIKNFIRKTAKEIELPFFDIRNQEGNLRNIMIRNTSIGEWMVCISFFEWNDTAQELMQRIKNEFPSITALLYTQNSKGNDTIYDLNIQVFEGREYIVEHLNALKFKVGPKSFFQTNSKQCVQLYEIVKEMAGFAGDELLYDLYCGVGSIGIFMSNSVKKVVGIELVEAAIEDAYENVAMNEIKNCEFFASDMRALFNKDFIKKHGKPDVIITDPPRAGMHPDVIEQLLDLECNKIVYVSCNPHTLANELNLLCEKYVITKIRPVDMFPQTLHLETIAVLELKK
jgi:23S rRNA (uracil1939-C5)-methyltransferase